MKDLFEPQLTGAGNVQAVPRPQKQELNIIIREFYFAKSVTNIHYVSNGDYQLKQKRLRANCVVNLLAQNFGQKETVDFLEVGCGEGFVLSSAVAKGLNVSGVDYQSAPVFAFHPVMVPRVEATEPNVYLNDLIEKGVKKDVLYLQNVLKHNLHPEELLCKLKHLLTDDGCIMVRVHNDFSELQALANQQGRINSDYWFLPSQHLNYFNEKKLPDVVRSCGFEIVEGISDFPIEVYLCGNAANYVTEKSNGMFAHQARVPWDLFFSKNGLDKYLQFYRAAFKICVGRNICDVLKKHPKADELSLAD